MVVNVIVPVYNGVAYIKRCISSVVKNNYQCANGITMKLTVVDDGSSDQTVAIVKKMTLEDDFMTILSQENSGAASARNHGLDKTSGDYVFFLDADDWLPDNAVESLVESAIRTNADITIGMSRYFIGRIPGPTTFETWHELKVGVIDPHHNNFLVEVTPGVRAKLFSRRLLEDMRFPQEKIKWEDLALVPALIAKATRISCVDRVVYNYMIHANTTVKDFIFKCDVLDIIKSLDILKENLQKFGVYDDFSEEYRSILTLHTLFRAENIITWVNTSTKLKKELTNKLLSELSKRYPDWQEDPVLVDPIKRYKDPFFNFMLKKLYL